MAYDERSWYGRAGNVGHAGRRRGCAGIALAVVLLAIALCAGCQAALGIDPFAWARQPTIKHDSLAPTYTHDGEVIRWYVLVDPDTSVQYLVNDRGGCTPRLDRYGTPIGTQAHDGEVDYG